MKRILSLLLACSMICSISFVGTLSAFAVEGSGIASDPYIITKAEELSQISDGGFYKLGADITVDSSVTGKSGFTLDGNNHTITLAMTGQGLFASLGGTVTIKNLVLDGSVTSSANNNAALIGQLDKDDSQINIINVINFASVNSSHSYSGSMVGYVSANNVTINITNSENYGDITSKMLASGFVGSIGKGEVNISSSYNYGTVNGPTYASGFVGVYGNATNALNINITDSGNYGKVIGDYIGGFITMTELSSSNMKFNIKRSFNAGIVQNTKDVGTRQAAFLNRINTTYLPDLTIEDCFNFGQIGHTQSGAFTSSGYFSYCGEIKNSYNATTVRHFSQTGTTENSYYLAGTVAQTTQNTTSVTEDQLQNDLSLFSSTDWEYVTNPDASENYSYPQLKTNRIYFGYKTLTKDTETYNDLSASLVKGEITGATTKPFSYGEKFSSSEFSVISPVGTYNGLGQTDIVYGNEFSINKSAVIYIASKDSAINSNGFEPLASENSLNACLYDKYGTKYYISSKTVVSDGNPVNIEAPSGASGVMVKWLDNAELTIPLSYEKGTVKVNGEALNADFSKTFIKGEPVTVTFAPDSGYYLKKMYSSSSVYEENKIDETDVLITLTKDIELNFDFAKYEPQLKFEILRETNNGGTIDQKVKLSGNAYDFMADKTITLEIKNSLNAVVLTENTTVGGDGKFEIVKLFTYPSDNYAVNVKIDNLTFLMEDDSNNGTYYIPTVAAINTLLTSLNNDTGLIDKNAFATDVETNKDLNFDVGVYKNLSSLKNDVVTRFLAYNDGAYSVDNISERFATSVILSVMNNGTAGQIKAASEYYEAEYLKLKDEAAYYADFNTLNDTVVYSLMTNCKYNSISDVRLNFKNSVVIGLIKATFNSGNILPILSKYKSELNIPEITTIDNYTNYKQKKALDYLSSKRNSINTYEALKATLEYIALNINTIAPPVIVPSSGGGGGGGSSVTVSGGGGGGGGSSQPSAIGKAQDVTSKYGDVSSEEETSKPTGELVYFNDFSDEIVGESPITATIAGSAGSAIVVNDKDKGNCVKIIDTDEGYGGIDLAKTFSPIDGPVAFEVEFQWLSGAGNVGMYVLMGNSGANAFSLATNTANSNLFYDTKNGTQNFPGSGLPLKKGYWYKARIVLDVKNQTANFTVKSDAYKNLNKNALVKSFSYDEKTNIVATGIIPLTAEYTDAISRVTFRTGRWQSEFLISYIKVEKNPVDLISKTEIKAPDAPTVPAPQPHAVEDEINIKLNGEYVYSYIKPIMRNDRVLVSVRNILEMFNMEVLWDGETETVTAKNEIDTVALKNNDINILVNGEVKKTDVPAQMYGDRIYVPLRFLSECFGMTVDWDGETQTVIIGG